MSNILNDAFAILFSDFLYKTYVVGTCLNEFPQHMFIKK